MPLPAPSPDAATPPQRAGWAVVGLGELAIDEILPAFARCRRSRPVALVSGHRDKAVRIGAAYGIERDAVYGYDDVQALRADPRIDIVYVVLPNTLHAQATIRALEAGKHVLCEKPMADNPAECERMIAAAKAADRRLMIAYRLHYEPFNRMAAALCRGGELGAVKTIVSSNCQVTLAPNIRLSAALGGGPIGDTGIYCINACRSVTGEEPLAVSAIAHRPADDPRFREVPESVAFLLRYPSGVIAHCDTSFGALENRFLQVNCSEGSVALEAAFAYQGQRLRITRQGSNGRRITEEPRLVPVNHFAAEMDHFSAAVLDGHEPRTPGELGLADVRIIAALERSLREGAMVDVGR